MNTIDTLIERSWTVHDEARNQEQLTPATDRLRQAIWNLEDALDTNPIELTNPTLGDLPDHVRDCVTTVIVARVHVQATAQGTPH